MSEEKKNESSGATQLAALQKNGWGAYWKLGPDEKVRFNWKGAAGQIGTDASVSLLLVAAVGGIFGRTVVRAEYEKVQHAISSAIEGEEHTSNNQTKPVPDAPSGPANVTVISHDNTQRAHEIGGQGGTFSVLNPDAVHAASDPIRAAIDSPYAGGRIILDENRKIVDFQLTHGGSFKGRGG